MCVLEQATPSGFLSRLVNAEPPRKPHMRVRGCGRPFCSPAPAPQGSGASSLLYDPSSAHQEATVPGRASERKKKGHSSGSRRTPRPGNVCVSSQQEQNTGLMGFPYKRSFHWRACLCDCGREYLLRSHVQVAGVVEIYRYVKRITSVSAA